jgi:hypothetical protein
MSDLKDVAKRIPHHRSTIAVGLVEGLFQRDRTGVERPRVRGVRVIDVDVQERGECLASVASFADSCTQGVLDDLERRA